MISRGFFIVLSFTLLVGAFPVSSLWAQDQNKTVDLPEAVKALEEKVIRLESEISVLRDRLEAVLGETLDDKVRNLPDGPSPVRGNPKSAITLVMFGDYQSVYTARAQHVVKRLLEKYPAQLKFIYKHYPLTQLHPLANEAALAALASEKQGLFWEYHDQLFLNNRRLDSTLVLVLAEQVGLDLSKFNGDRHSLWALDRLAGDEKLAVASGVTGLPTVFLNGRPMATWRYDYVQAKVEKLLAASSRPGR